MVSSDGAAWREYRRTAAVGGTIGGMARWRVPCIAQKRAIATLYFNIHAAAATTVQHGGADVATVEGNLTDPVGQMTIRLDSPDSPLPFPPFNLLCTCKRMHLVTFFDAA